ncbi:hypothetical protein BH23ACT5_BH23ACT5_10800 [soil metagenome]
MTRLFASIPGAVSRPPQEAGFSTVTGPRTQVRDGTLGSVVRIGDNDPMELSAEERHALAEALEALSVVDAADMPEPAARLAELLSRLLDPAQGEP